MSGNVQALINLHKQKQDASVEGDRRIQAGLQATLATRGRLDTSQLQAAGCDRSKNPILLELWDQVKDYNDTWTHPSKMSDAQLAHSVGVLDGIYQTCATYMTDKSFKLTNSRGATAKRKLRYEAFKVLLQSVVKEMESLGGKTLSGPADFLQNKRNYWLERLDSEHRAGYLISDKYNTWVNSGSTLSFWAWLQVNGGPALKSQSKVKGYENPERAQWEHCKFFDGGLVRNAEDDLPFCTAAMQTEFSKNGWAVFVCSVPMTDPAGNFGVFIFSYTHRAGWDHHSSFLGGMPVMAAGEWVVDATGRVKVITGKSGHYMPKWENLHKLVVRFPEIPGDAIIRPNMLDHNNGADKIKFYTVQDFRSRRLNATPLRRSVVISKITPANTNITEHLPGGITKTLADLLPA